MRTYLGFDFGGTKLLVGEVDEKGNILRSKRYSTGCLSMEDAVERVLKCAKDYRDTVGFQGDVQAAGVGIVGVSDHKKGEWISMTHIVSGPPVPLAAMLEQILGVPVGIDNDVRSATTAEWKLGWGKESDNFIYINVGTGLAAGFVVNGVLLRGANNNSGEVGHSVVNITEKQDCICGRSGCVENVLSGSGFAKQAVRYGLSEIIRADNPNSADASKLFELADAGKEQAELIAGYGVETLAALIMNLVRVTDPDTVILGGGVTAGGWLLEKVKPLLNPSTMRGVTKGVVLSEFQPEFVGLIGAAAVGMEIGKERSDRKETFPLQKEKSLEAELEKKEVISKKYLWEDGKEYQPVALQQGHVSILGDREKIIRLQAPMTAGHWPEGAPADGDYTNYGTAAFAFYPRGENWEEYNRLRFRVCPKVRTGTVMHLNVSVTNEGKIPVPDAYYREGTTVFNLQNGVWNDCIWEFPSLGRDKITSLTFYVYLGGQCLDFEDELVYDFKDFCLEQVNCPEVEKGWECEKGRIVLSTAGYFPQGKKEAIANIACEQFQLCSAKDDRVVFEDKAREVENERGSFRVLDFSDVEETGTYYLRINESRSCDFVIADTIEEEAVWKLLNFVSKLRCGTPVSGVHGSCHLDSMAEHNGVKLSFAGGWHDAGDLSQQVVHTGEMVHALCEAAEKHSTNRELYQRLLEEAGWGLDFILRTRFGDGYRATSAGATRYTANKVGDFDDVMVRVFDHSYENFLFAGIEAYAAYIFGEAEPELAESALKAAVEDFAFAEKKFAETGVEPAHMYEHTYNSGLSQYYAVIVWAAANLYRICGERQYAKEAVEYGDKLLACQERGDAGLPMKGFFYRDETHQSIVHFNHQSREHQFVQALVMLCGILPEHSNYDLWCRALEDYVSYRKAIQDNTAPYGMMPAGVHRLDEADDKELFPYMHILVDYEKEYPHYKAQLEQGKKLDEYHVLKNFPVWFSFRGNNAILLSSGIAMAQAGQILKDEDACEIAREQLYWIWGKNPFGQSLQYGMGSRFCSQYGVYVGETVGEVPVGIETYGDEDVPYWPQSNNATYKEVWIATACRMLWLLNAL